jgi:hypothetical protein
MLPNRCGLSASPAGGLHMKTLEDEASLSEDRRVAAKPVAKDRRIGVSNRRRESRMRTLKGAQIVWPTAAPVKCVVRNLSKIGAALELQIPVANNFELVFDGDQSRRSCIVVWRRPGRIGVKFR